MKTQPAGEVSALDWSGDAVAHELAQPLDCYIFGAGDSAEDLRLELALPAFGSEPQYADPDKNARGASWLADIALLGDDAGCDTNVHELARCEGDSADAAYTSNGHISDRYLGDADEADVAFETDPTTLSESSQHRSLAGSPTVSSAAPGAAPEDFWFDVVKLQQYLGQHPGLRTTALDCAISWVSAGLSLQSLTAARIAEREWSSAQPSTSTATSTPRQAGTSALSSGDTSLDARVSLLFDDLGRSAVRALVVACEQRGSALRAAAGNRG